VIPGPRRDLSTTVPHRVDDNTWEYRQVPKSEMPTKAEMDMLARQQEHELWEFRGTDDHGRPYPYDL